MKSNFKEGPCGYAFKNGKLFWFDKRHVLVMTSWPDPRSWMKRRSHNWKSSRKWADQLFGIAAGSLSQPVDLGIPIQTEPDTLSSGQCLLPGIIYGPKEQIWHAIHRRNTEIFASFLEPIPPDILSDLMRYSNRRWHILNLLARCSGAFDLGHSNPALLYALASNWVFHKPVVTQPIRAARSLINVNQKQILTWLGFPGTETVRHIMRKIVPASLTVEALLYLRESLQDPDVTKCLSHLDRINAGVLRLVTDQKYRVYLSPRLLNDIGIDHNQDEPHPPFLALFKDTLMMADMVDWKNCPRRFTSLARLNGVHDELSRYVMPVVMAKACALPTRFPVPPFAGTDSIRPILTPTELFSEGLEMKHCAAIRATGVAKGQEYLYRVFSPVRATLGICRHKAGWQPGQLFKECNVAVAPDVRNALFAELFRSGHSEESLHSGCRMSSHAFVGDIS